MKELIKKISSFLSSVLIWSLFTFLIIVFIMTSAYYIDQLVGAKKGDDRSPLFGAYVIISPSMVPNINVNDAVVTARVKIAKIKTNDVITFLSKEIDTEGTPITHRVVGIFNLDGKVAYRTKGDANESVDRALIRDDEVLGKVILRVPLIGYAKNFFSNNPGWLIIIVIPCLIIIVTDVIKVLKLVTESNKKNTKSKRTNQ